MDEKKQLIRLTQYVNLALLLFVIGFAVFFRLNQADFLFYYSLPLIPIYLFHFYLIRREWLTWYVWQVYLLIGVYMILCTLFLGYQTGFHLYCMSLIPIIFVVEYMGARLKRKTARPIFISILLAVSSLGCTLYAVIAGPIYTLSAGATLFCLAYNSLIVFFFLIFYAAYMVRMILASEEKLENMAHLDRLTGLYNRHYFVDFVDTKMPQDLAGTWLALMDLDNFKTINDTHGHLCGDRVLQQVSERMRACCPDCTLCRWGGEEFLMLSKNGTPIEQAEALRTAVAGMQFLHEGAPIQLTVTIGVTGYRRGRSFTEWARKADELMYQGKKAGKNKVIYEK